MEESQEVCLRPDQGIKRNFKHHSQGHSQGQGHKTSWKKLFTLTCVTWFGFTTHGLATALPGATLLDLAQLTGSTISQVSWILTGRSLGGLLGACLLPLITRKFTCWGPLGVAQVTIGVLSGVVPLCRTNAQMIGVFIGIGIARSFVDAASIFVLLDIWGPANGPWLSGMICVYGIGSLIAPIIAAPFVASHVNFTTHFKVNMSLQQSSALRINLIKVYIIISTIVILSGIALLCCAYICYRHWTIISHSSMKPDEKSHFKRQKNGPVVVSSTEVRYLVKKRCELSFEHVFVALMSMFTLSYCLVEHMCGMFLVTFLVDYLSWSNTSAILLLSVFYAAATVSRGIAGLLIKFIQTKYILIVFIGISLTSAVSLALCCQSHQAVIWVCICGFAIGNSPLFPVGVTYADRYLVVCPLVSGILQVACTTAAIIAPFTVGNVYESLGPLSFVYILLIGSCLLLGIFACMHILSSRHGERRRGGIKLKDVRFG